MGDTNPSSNYFTFIVYPDEFYEAHLDENIFWELGTVYKSPLHNANELQVPSPLEFNAKTKYGFVTFRAINQNKKPHWHFLVKTPNKMSVNKFGMCLSKILKNDFCGVAYCDSQALVKYPEIMLRYFYHVDSPMKESFCLMDAFREVPCNFTKEFVKAFDVEIRAIITSGIQSGEIENIQQILFYNDSSLVFTEWLYRGRNMYVINSMFNELRKVKVSK